MRYQKETSIRLDGDLAKAQKYIGRARVELGILLNSMKPMGLPTGIRRRRLADDVYCEVRSLYGSQYIYILAQTVAHKELPKCQGYLMESGLLGFNLEEIPTGTAGVYWNVGSDTDAPPLVPNINTTGSGYMLGGYESLDGAIEFPEVSPISGGRYESFIYGGDDGNGGPRGASLSFNDLDAPDSTKYTGLLRLCAQAKFGAGRKFTADLSPGGEDAYEPIAPEIHGIVKMRPAIPGDPQGRTDLMYWLVGIQDDFVFSVRLQFTCYSETIRQQVVNGELPLDDHYEAYILAGATLDADTTKRQDIGVSSSIPGQPLAHGWHFSPVGDECSIVAVSYTGSNSVYDTTLATITFSYSGGSLDATLTTQAGQIQPIKPVKVWVGTTAQTMWNVADYCSAPTAVAATGPVYCYYDRQGQLVTVTMQTKPGRTDANATTTQLGESYPGILYDYATETSFDYYSYTYLTTVKLSATGGSANYSTTPRGSREISNVGALAISSSPSLSSDWGPDYYIGCYAFTPFEIPTYNGYQYPYNQVDIEYRRDDKSLGENIVDLIISLDDPDCVFMLDGHRGGSNSFRDFNISKDFGWNRTSKHGTTGVWRIGSAGLGAGNRHVWPCITSGGDPGWGNSVELVRIACMDFGLSYNPHAEFGPVVYGTETIDPEVTLVKLDADGVDERQIDYFAVNWKETYHTNVCTNMPDPLKVTQKGPYSGNFKMFTDETDCRAANGRDGSYDELVLSKDIIRWGGWA